MIGQAVGATNIQTRQAGQSYATTNACNLYAKQARQMVAGRVVSELGAAGKFSVGAVRQVEFSKGNLQYQASIRTWRFAEHQWDVIGQDNKNISSSYSGWIDLFGWGTGSNPTKNSKNNSDYSYFSDWGRQCHFQWWK